MFLEISQSSLENTCDRVSFLLNTSGPLLSRIAMAVETMKITISQLILLKVLSNSVTDNISIASTTTSSTSCIREWIEGQNLHDTPSVDQVAKGLRLKINRKKLEQLLSIGFPVRKTAKDGLPGTKIRDSS